LADTGGVSLKKLQKWAEETQIAKRFPSRLQPTFKVRRRLMRNMERLVAERALPSDVRPDREERDIGADAAETRTEWPDLFTYHFPELVGLAMDKRATRATIGKFIEHIMHTREMVRSTDARLDRLRRDVQHIDPKRPNPPAPPPRHCSQPPRLRQRAGLSRW
jgi:hypothetical protein